MEFLVFLLVVCNLSLVYTDEIATDETGVTHHQDTYKVHEPEDLESQNDQIAESSRTISQTHGELQGRSQNQIPPSPGKLGVIDVRQTSQDQAAQQTLHVPETLRHNTEEVNNVEYKTAIQPNIGYTNEPHQIYLQQYSLEPIRILEVEASPLRQTYENEGQKAFGYSSYVEHVSKRDEEEIKSALKEGSVSDIKRLVPKSGISFKIYHGKENADVENQKSETQSNPAVTHSHLKIATGFSQKPKLHYKVSTTQLPSAVHPSATFGLENLQQTHIKTETGGRVQGYHDSRSVAATSHSQNEHNVQTVYHSRPDVNPHKTVLQVNGKSSVSAKPHLQISVGDNDYKKVTSATEYNSLAANKHGLSDVANVQYQKQWNFDNKLEGSKKAVKKVKPLVATHYEIDPLPQADKGQGLRHFQNQDAEPGSRIAFNEHKIPNSFPEAPTANGNYPSNAYILKGNQNNFVGHLSNRVYTDKKVVLNRLPGNHVNSEVIKAGQTHVINHINPNVFGDPKRNQGEHFATSSYADSETAKSNQHGLITHVGHSHVETKNSQSSFDHQKALEGSTSFDIKNAIDTANLAHQTHYVAPTTDVHPVEDIQKQQVTYVIPKIPSSTVLLEDSIRETPVLEAHHTKDFNHAVLSSPPQLSYHAVSSPDVSGKFFHQPQTILWTSEHLKQGNALTASDLHQSLIKLHLPKEEIYQHLKTPPVEFPTSTISHVTYPQPKQPYVLHYDGPILKYPQEIHFQPKTKTRIQSGQPHQLKLTQPVAVDWSLLKIPNVNINSIGLKPEFVSHVPDGGKKIVPILVRKRKNRSNGKQEVGVVYGKVSGSRRPTKPNNRQEKSIRVNLLPEASTKVNQFEPKRDRKNEFSVSASYKVDRSIQIPSSS